MNLEQELRHHKLRVTQARVTVLGILKNEGHPLTIKEIEKKIQENDLQINLSTIYRILDQFESSRLLIKSVPQKPFEPLYEYRHDVHSHYLICIRCGEIQVIEHCPLEAYEAKVSQEKGYQITSHRFELYGYCGRCQLEVNV